MKKLNLFQNLFIEMTQRLNMFKLLIQNNNGTRTNYMAIHNNLKTIKKK